MGRRQPHIGQWGSPGIGQVGHRAAEGEWEPTDLPSGGPDAVSSTLGLQGREMGTFIHPQLENKPWSLQKPLACWKPDTSVFLSSCHEILFPYSNKKEREVRFSPEGLPQGEGVQMQC